MCYGIFGHYHFDLLAYTMGPLVKLLVAETDGKIHHCISNITHSHYMYVRVSVFGFLVNFSENYMAV